MTVSPTGPEHQRGGEQRDAPFTATLPAELLGHPDLRSGILHGPGLHQGQRQQPQSHPRLRRGQHKGAAPHEHGDQGIGFLNVSG